jgi:hypothetical protein
MDLLLIESPGEFIFPCERIVGRIDALHRDPLEAHADEVKQARAEAAEFNRLFAHSTQKTKG